MVGFASVERKYVSRLYCDAALTEMGTERSNVDEIELRPWKKIVAESYFQLKIVGGYAITVNLNCL